MKFVLALDFLLCLGAVDAGLRHSADRIRSIRTAPDWSDAAQLITIFQEEEHDLEEEEASITELVEAFEASTTGMSMGPTNSPSAFSMPSDSPSIADPFDFNTTVAPTWSVAPSAAPTGVPTVSVVPSAAPTVFPTLSIPPTNASSSVAPTLSAAPSAAPSDPPTLSVAPSATPTDPPTLSVAPSATPTDPPTLSVAPSATPTATPTVSVAPSVGVTGAPSNGPTLSVCGITPEERETAILGILDQVANSTLIRDLSTPQGLATNWIINEDAGQLCPDEPKIVQRWSLAVMYFSTGGDDWTECFSGDVSCTTSPAFLGEDAFLSESNECEWAGISCDFESRVTEIEFEDNNLAGTIPTEFGLLDELFVWGMERGNLTGPIPSEIGRLSNLIFIDLDFNALTGTFPTELYSLVNLTQLDLNNNLLEGNVVGLGNFSDLEFLQLHSNLFTGTIPEQVGTFPFLGAFTLHDNSFTGAVPTGLCDLVTDGTLTSLIADCAGAVPKIDCDCCTDCRPIFF